MEESLRCTICRDLFTIPVSVRPCHHSFCSECIRKCLAEYQRTRFSQKSACPLCRTPLLVGGGKDVSKCLTANHALEDTIRHYRRVRPLLRHTLAVSAATTTGAAAAATTTDEANPDLDSKRTEAAPPPNDSTTTTATSTTTQNDTVEDQNSSNSAAAPTHTLQRRRTYMYSHYKKRKQLQDLCRAEGLSTAGTDAQLRDRHAAFCLKVNAECDSRRPRTLDELRREFNRHEHAKQTQSMQWEHESTESMMRTLYETRKQAGSTQDGGTSTKTTTRITTGNAQMDHTMNQNFAAMIQQLRAAKQKNKKQQQQQPKPQETSEGNSKSSSSPNEEEDGNESSTKSPTVAAVPLKPDKPSNHEALEPRSETTMTADPVEGKLDVCKAQEEDDDDYSDTDASEIQRLEQEVEGFPDMFAEFRLDELKQAKKERREERRRLRLAGQSMTTTTTPIGSKRSTVPLSSTSSLPVAVVTGSCQKSTSADRKHARSYETSADRPEPMAALENDDESVQVVQPSPRETAATTTTLESFFPNKRRRKSKSSSHSSKNSRKSSNAGPWTCPSCTYRNDKPLYLSATAKCEMCERRRPPPPIVAPAAVTSTTTPTSIHQ